MFARTVFLLAFLLAPVVQAAPAIESWQTDNGARVLFVHSEALPMVDLRVVFDAGAARDGDRPGLARLTNRLLGQGTEARSADAVAAAFDRVGARFSHGSKRDMAYFSLRALSMPERLEPAVATFAELLRAPAFGERAFERERRRMLQAVKAREQDPGSVARRVFYDAVYGDHPYATPPGGTAASLEAIDRGAVRAFHRRFYVGANATVAIMGDLSRERAEALAETVVGELPRGEAAPSLPAVEPLEAARTVRVDFPSRQAHILMGQPGMARGEPDYHALYLANHVLGGSGFSSRLMSEIREARGLAYSVYSYFAPMAARGPFVMGMQTQGSQAGEAIELLRDNLAAFVEDGPTAEEVEHAQKNITGGFPLRIDSNREIVQYLAMIGFYDLPLDYLDRFSGQVAAVDAADAREAFAGRIDPGRLVTVVVGGGAGADDGA